MSVNLNTTPKANRLHIGIYGRRNAGKSTLINALTGQDAALVSDTPGTTADPVYKSMELHPVGPVVFIDTAGYDDEGELGGLRVEKTRDTLNRVDIAVLVTDGITPDSDGLDAQWEKLLGDHDVPVIKAERGAYTIEELRKKIADAVPEEYMREKIIGDMVKDGGLALLVMPQDIQAPKGRLILPQVQTIRELLDKRCVTVSVTADGLEAALAVLNRAPDLIVTDSQCFNQVYDAKPDESLMTSFSVLFAAYKGDIGKLTEGAKALDHLLEKEGKVKVLIAEACTHVPQTEDIGRVKIPRALRKFFSRKYGEAAADVLEIVNVCGNDFPAGDELAGYDLVIHCGACMFNRKHVLSRIAVAEAAGVPITNYGIILARFGGILDKITLPGKE